MLLELRSFSLSTEKGRVCTSAVFMDNRSGDGEGMMGGTAPSGLRSLSRGP